MTALTSCKKNTAANTNDSADTALSRKTEQAMKEANRQVGMPAIKNFQERKLMKMILELRDQENLVCHAYIVNLEGKLIYLGQCVGYGLPYSVQYTNPEKVAINEHRTHAHGGDHSVWGTLPQPDPNGLFMPDGLAATWLMLIDKESGEPRPVYVEPEILVSPFKLH